MRYFLLFYHSFSISFIKNGDSITFTGNGTITHKDLEDSGGYTTYNVITLDEGITTIGGEFLHYSKQLIKLIIPKSLNNIIGPVLFRTPSFATFEFSDGSEHFYIDNQGGLYNYKKTELISIPSTKTQFSIPKSVTKIRSRAINGALQRIEIPNSVEILEAVCFNEMYSLEAVTFEQGSRITVFNERSFWFESADEFHIPPSVERIKSEAFKSAGLSRLIFDDIDKSNLTFIGAYSFENFVGTEITLPRSVITVDSKAFFNSKNLRTINIPGNCSLFQLDALAGCSSLVSVSVDSGSKSYQSVNGSLYNANRTSILFIPPKSTNFTIIDELEIIGQGVVQAAKDLTSISVSPNNKHFSSYDGLLFDYNGTILKAICGGVKTIKLQSNVTQIEQNCASNTEVSKIEFIGTSTLQIIGEYAFSECKQLAAITIPKSVTTIGRNAFSSSEIKTLTFENNSSLNIIASQSFSSIEIRSLKIPPNLFKISEKCFAYLNRLESIDFSEAEKLTIIDSEGFRGCSNLAKIIISRSVETISDSAFAYCEKLEVEFASGSALKTINEKAFQACLSMSQIELPSSIESIGMLAFEECKSLSIVNFSECLKLIQIGPNCFTNCTSIESITLPQNLENIDQSVFEGCIKLVSIAAHNLSGYLDSSNGILYTKGYKELLICPPGLQIASVVNQLKSIRSNAFKNCSVLHEVIFGQPSNLKTIGKYTFYGCFNLSIIYPPERVSKIESGCFADCYHLKKVIFQPDSALLSLGASVFSGCKELSTIDFGKNSVLRVIEDSVFENCQMLSEIEIPLSVGSIGNKALKGTQINKIEFGPNFESIGQSAFEDCSKLISVIFHQNSLLRTISSNAFCNCIKLENVVLSMQINSIENSAFKSTSIEFIKFGSNVSSIGEESFENCSKLSSVVYCGEKNPGNFGSFPSATKVFCTVAYKSETFCGLQVFRGLTADCLPLPTHSYVFTQGIAFDRIGVAYTSVLLYDCSE